MYANFDLMFLYTLSAGSRRYALILRPLFRSVTPAALLSMTMSQSCFLSFFYINGACIALQFRYRYQNVPDCFVHFQYQHNHYGIPCTQSILILSIYSDYFINVLLKGIKMLNSETSRLMCAAVSTASSQDTTGKQTLFKSA